MCCRSLAPGALRLILGSISAVLGSSGRGRGRRWKGASDLDSNSSACSSDLDPEAGAERVVSTTVVGRRPSRAAAWTAPSTSMRRRRKRNSMRPIHGAGVTVAHVWARSRGVQFVQFAVLACSARLVQRPQTIQSGARWAARTGCLGCTGRALRRGAAVRALSQRRGPLKKSPRTPVVPTIVLLVHHYIPLYLSVSQTM